MNAPPVRLAIMGSGGIAHTHAEAISRLRDARLVCVCSRNAEKTRELAAAFGAFACTQWGEVVHNAEIDAVLVATPSGTHEAIALPALRAGKHVLCEKPLEISLARVARMIIEARQAGLVLAGFFPMRCGDGIETIRQALRAGRFGRLAFVSARVKWWRDENYYRSSNWRGTWELDGGGALMNQGIHAVDLLQWLGGPVREVTAYAATLVHPGLQVEDTLAACLRFENGALGTIEVATSCYPGLDLSLEISGDHGSAILVNDKIKFWHLNGGDPREDGTKVASGEGTIHGGTSDPRAISCEGHRRQIAEFCRAVRGLPSQTINGEEAGRAVAIVEAIYRSCRSGKSEAIERL